MILHVLLIYLHQHIVLLCASKQFFFLLKIKTKHLQVSCTLTYSKFSFLNLLENAFCNCEIARFKLHNHNCKRLTTRCIIYRSFAQYCCSSRKCNLVGAFFTSRAADESYFAVVSSSSSSGDFCFLAMVSVFSLL